MAAIYRDVEQSYIYMLEEELKQGISEMHEDHGVVVLNTDAGQDRPRP